jgi:hypothetical protein
MAKFCGGISPLLKESIKLHHLHCDVLEQVDAHPKMPPKISFGICQIFIEIRPHQLLVPFNPFPPQLLSTEHRSTYFWLLSDVACQLYGYILFFLYIVLLVR